jgi:hypothetical protein
MRHNILIKFIPKGEELYNANVSIPSEISDYNILLNPSRIMLKLHLFKKNTV